MTAAPESGYQNGMILDEPLIRSLSSSPDRQLFFYFKLDNLYGKAAISLIPLHAASESQLAVHIYLRRDGSRMLQTKPWVK